MLILTDYGEGYDNLSRMLKLKGFPANFHDNEIGLNVQPGIGSHYIFSYYHKTQLDFVQILLLENKLANCSSKFCCIINC